MSKHTPGPWLIGTPPPNGEMTVGTEQGLMVAVATTGLDMPTGANARLIAAAPETAAERDRLKEINAELLEALTLILDLNDHEVWTKESWRIALDKAHTAIVKATGDNQ